jgi:uncharacterized phage protein (TIGR01671 family)
MRQILFRGFNRKNGVWLYGFYLQNRGAHFVCPDEFAEGKSWDDYEIDPETRGEYTGQKDKNGQEIYEGDIMRDVDGNTCEVIWQQESAGFRQYDHVLQLCDNFIEEEFDEIIGNIHDNPELLKTTD